MRILFGPILAFILMAGSISAVAQTGECPDEDFECQAAESIKRIAADPNDTEAYYNLGAAYHYLGKDDLAVANLTKYIAHKPDGIKNLADGYISRGNSYRLLRQFNLAFADFAKAMQVNPADPEAWYNRGLTYQETGQIAKAIADYDKYISMGTENKTNLADGYNDRGVAYAKLGNLIRAVSDYTMAIQTDPNKGKFYRNRALVYRKQGKISLAKADEEKADSLPKTVIN